jgi:putative ABC transport system permease protein
MWRSHLTISLRALVKNRTYAFITIFGLALSLAACLLILLYVRSQLSYDAQLPNAKNTYQLQSQISDNQTGEPTRFQMTSYVSATAFRKDFPQVERSVYALAGDGVVLRGGVALPAEDVLLVDNLFFDVLRFPFHRGDAGQALAQVGSAVLTATEARRIFGREDAVGETLTLASGSDKTDYRVTGVIEDLPRNSHAKFGIVARIDPSSHLAGDPGLLIDWGWTSGWLYLSLKPGTDPAEIQRAFPAWEKRNIPDQVYGETVYNAGSEQDWKLVNIRDIHLGEAKKGAMKPGNDRSTIYTFTIIAALILIMACVNFTNLATARASQRAREVALKKTFGASRRQLIVQFLGEATLVAFLAMLLALGAVELSLPAFSSFLNTDLDLDYLGPNGVLPPIIGLVLLVGLLGGLYPAFYLSRFQPGQILKANQSSAEPQGSGRLRNSLVVGQFAVSIGLIICTIIVYSQTSFARTSDPGYDRENLIQVTNLGRPELLPLANTIVREIGRVKGVTAVGRSGIGVATNKSSTTAVRAPGQAGRVDLGTYDVDAGFFRTMGMEPIAGRLFEENRAADDATLPVPTDPAAEKALGARGVNVVVNRLAARQMGFADPERAIGQQITLPFSPAPGGVLTATIIGVIENPRFRSIRDPIDPLMFTQNRNGAGTLLIRHDGSDPTGVRARIEVVWKRLAPEVPLDGEFSEDRVAQLYQGEEARTRTFVGFALLAIVVACLGLFGLAAFTADRRTKEIGIRKVLGARSIDIVKLLAWQFSKPVIIANLLAWPLAWWTMRDWLNGFDARIALTPGPFIIAGALALGIALATIAGHAIRVARARPVTALRYD